MILVVQNVPHDYNYVDFSILQVNYIHLISYVCFSYFSQLLPLLEDESVYCLSAWNDQVSVMQHIRVLYTHIHLKASRAVEFL